MNCKQCGQPLPEGSTFCPYCGTALEAPQPQAAFPSLADDSSAMQGKKKRDKLKKERLCEQCGAPLGKKAKACPICGAPVLRRPINLKPVLIAMSVAICLLLCGTSYFMLEMFQGNAAITRLEGEKAELIAQQERDRIELERYELALERYERNIKSLEEEKAELEDSYDALYYKALFMDVNVVIVGTGRYYHSYDCPRLDMSDGFYVFNSENAKYQGYRRCDYCRPL